MRAISFLLLLSCLSVTASAQTPKAPAVVKFFEPRIDVVETDSAPIDPTFRVMLRMTGGMAYGLNAENVRLTFSAGSARTTFKIDGQLVHPSAGPVALPARTPQGKARHGYQTVHKSGDLTITQTIEAVPTRPSKPGAARRLDAVLVRYDISNKGTAARTVETRVRIDTHCNNDGALFAAPTFPGKVLDGIELKEKTLPPYVQIMQNPDPKNPINRGHFTLKFGSRMIGPHRFLCTAHGAGDDGWNVPVQQAMGDSDCAMYWKPETIAPGATVTLAYAYGIGLATSPDGEGRVSLAFGGSFEPGKLFTIVANVEDPAGNQILNLELPRGIELVEGKRTQPIAQPPADSATSTVLWKCRVRELGDFSLRFHSNTGVTYTRRFTVSRP